MPASNNNDILHKIHQYKRKHYTNLLLRGLIWALSSLLAVYLVVTFTEYWAHFGKAIRAVLFFSFVFFALVILWRWVLKPLSYLLAITKPFSDEEAAQRIGQHFPEVQDKLLNFLQMRKLAQQDALALASLNQRTAQISTVPFTSAINYTENRRYLRYFIPLVVLALLLAWLMPDLFTSSTERIVRYQQEFVPAAPFTFNLQNKSLQAFRNEDFTLQLSFNGEPVPQTAYLLQNGRRYKMQQQAGLFQYTFTNVQEAKSFSFEAAGFESQTFNLSLVDRPDVIGFSVRLVYPTYLNRPAETLENTGSFTAPQGTLADWQFFTQSAEKLHVKFQNDSIVKSLAIGSNQQASLERKLMQSENYRIELQNKYSRNKEDIQYGIDVIPDLHPKISLNQFADTVLYNFVVLGGNLSDDYGLTQLSLFYRKQGEQTYKQEKLALSPNTISQTYYHRWNLKELNLNKDDKLEYFLQVWDNDGVNGRKASRTRSYTIQLPDKQEVNERIKQGEQKAKSEISKNISETKELRQQLKSLQDRLRGKNQLNYGDEKALEQLMEERRKLEESIQELMEQQKALQEQRERFTEQDEKIAEKAQQLQELMDELLDEETKRLYDELQKLMEENGNSEQLQQMLENIDHKEQNLEKELERAVELFKRMQFEQKLDEKVEQLQEMQQKQEELAEQSEQKNADADQIQQEQEQLNKEFEEFQQEMKQLEEMNEDLKNPNQMEDTQAEEEQIKEQQEESLDQLKDNKPKKASKPQKNAAQQMQQMQKKMQQSQSGMQMQQAQENLDNLRKIVDNLVTLSFNQEQTMKEFRKVNQSDPRFVELGQTQLKLKDDAKVIEDSLQALAERVFQLKSFITREVSDMNRYMDGSVEGIRERKKNVASSQQQFAMTSMNNLALMLDDVLQQMQQQMAEAMGMPQKGQQQGKSPSLGQMQQQLNEQIRELKQSGKSGRQLSEALAKMAAEQERIREALKKLEEKFGKDGNLPGEGEAGQEALKKLMEETERDLVNKNLSRQLIERQQQIQTRLLEAEEALQERELDNERKGEAAQDYDKQIPKALEEYLKEKEKEVELLRTVPPSMNQFYKEETNRYFKRLER